MVRRTDVSISIVIPAFNEHATIASIIERSIAVLDACTDDYEVVVLDDASTDDTYAIARSIQDRNPAVRLERNPTNRGIAATFETLYQLASKEFVFLVAGDGQFPPELLAAFVPELASHDIVVCRRVHKEYTPYRQFISSCYRWLPRVLFGVDLVDPGGVKCVRRGVLQSISVQSTSVFVEAERLIRAMKRGYRVTSVDMEQVARKGGAARGAALRNVLLSTADMLRLWVDLVILRRPA